MFLLQSGNGVDILSSQGIFILFIGISFTIGLPVVMIKYGRKDSN